ncbi:hypothetical protein BBW65_00985 [Helicobacter enhydrae]|uniref:TolC family protein n=1 Tax=Helicobacter enhydrae TaxID=222136 RepID=A0A1B1U3W2_9HELI|nr:TolC family protein [Helicobacter enhydrae]ANV97474.1 hypothetical protein BBW65_00985 [Helicobacter enhydrae]
MKILGVLCLGVVGCLALTLDESIERVFANSHKIKEQEYLLLKLQSELGVKESAYYPKLNFHYRFGAKNAEYGNRASVELGLNLFNGLKDYQEVQIQKQTIQEQEANKKRTQEELRYLVKKLYVQILMTKGRLAISKESYKLLELQLKQAEQFYKQGISAKNNVLSVELTLASAKLEINSYTNQLNFLVSSLESLMNAKVKIDEIEDLPVCEEEVDYDHLSLVMFEHKPRYRAMLEREKALLYRIEQAKGGYYPKIDLGVSGDVPFGGKLYGEAQGSVYLGLTWNLFNGLGDSASVEMRRYELMSLRAQMTAYRQDALIELEKAVGDFNLARDQYVLSKKTIESANENYRIVSNRYKQNLQSSNDLLDAELMLKNAKSNLLKTKYETWESLFYVEFLVGGNRQLFIGF